MAGVYVSFPFCPHKCSFCNFASGVFPQGLEAQYLRALRAEIVRQRWQWQPDTLYLGGGTPSTLSAENLREIVSALPATTWREATMEVLPGSFSREQASAWRAFGFNRVSLGVQSLLAEELDQTGRRHTAETVAADFDSLRSAGFSNLSLDLIAGLPHQNPESWHVTLDGVERLKPQHVSIYLLEVDEKSRLGLEALRGGRKYGAAQIPGEDEAAGLYEIAVRRLGQMGLRRYEISNFAQPGFESVHNLKYWTLAPYEGFGAGAHSFDGERRWANPPSIPDYIAQPRREEEPAYPDSEKFYIGLRLTSGVEADAGDWQRYGPVLNRLLSEGWLEQSGPRLRLSDRAVLVSNEILQEFVHS